MINGEHKDLPGQNNGGNHSIKVCLGAFQCWGIFAFDFPSCFLV